MLAGSDWIGSEWVLDRRKWLDMVDGKTSHTLELRGARRILTRSSLEELGGLGPTRRVVEAWGLQASRLGGRLEAGGGSLDDDDGDGGE